MSWRSEGRLRLTVHTSESPTPEEWRRYMHDVHDMRAEHRVIVFSRGGGPDGVQRKQLNETLRDNPRVAIITSNRVARAAVSVIGLFHKSIRAFELGDEGLAFAYLELTDGEQRRVRELAKEMERELCIDLTIRPSPVQH